MEICLVWTQARNGAIGRAGQRPWCSPEGERYVGELTAGHPVLMGRNSWESLPAGALRGSQLIVLSRRLRSVAGAAVCDSLSEALTLASVLHSGRAFIVGGAQLYAQALTVADRLFVTRVQLDIDDADVFAPNIDPARFERCECRSVASDSGPALLFEEFRRRDRRY